MTMLGQRTQRMVARGRGRPRRQQADCIREDMKVANVAKQAALDGAKWKLRIQTDDPT